MGNVAACAPSIISGGGVVKVLHSDGRLVIRPNPTKAAEIMLENPGHFLCDSINLKVGQRIPGISADEELECGQLYFLLPMEMLYSVLTEEEMKFLSDKATKGLKHGSLNFSRIFPAFGDHFCLFPSSEVKGGGGGGSSESGLVEEVERFSRQRSWQPALETIVETPPRIKSRS